MIASTAFILNGLCVSQSLPQNFGSSSIASGSTSADLFGKVKGKPIIRARLESAEQEANCPKIATRQSKSASNIQKRWSRGLVGIAGAFLLCSPAWASPMFTLWPPETTASSTQVSSDAPSVESILARQLALRFREMTDEELTEVLEQLLRASQSSLFSQTDASKMKDVGKSEASSFPTAQDGQDVYKGMEKSSKTANTESQNEASTRNGTWENLNVEGQIKKENDSDGVDAHNKNQNASDRTGTPSPTKVGKDPEGLSGKDMENTEVDVTGLLLEEWRQRLQGSQHAKQLQGIPGESTNFLEDGALEHGNEESLPESVLRMGSATMNKAEQTFGSLFFWSSFQRKAILICLVAASGLSFVLFGGGRFLISREGNKLPVSDGKSQSIELLKRNQSVDGSVGKNIGGSVTIKNEINVNGGTLKNVLSLFRPLSAGNNNGKKDTGNFFISLFNGFRAFGYQLLIFSQLFEGWEGLISGKTSKVETLPHQNSPNFRKAESTVSRLVEVNAETTSLQSPLGKELSGEEMESLSSLENGRNSDERKKREDKIDASSSRISTGFDTDVSLPSLRKHTRTLDVDALNHRQGTVGMRSSNSPFSFSSKGSMEGLQVGINEVDYGENREQGHAFSLENGGNDDEKKREGNIDGSSSRMVTGFDNDVSLPSLRKHTRTVDVDALNHRQGTGRLRSSSKGPFSFSSKSSMKRLQVGISEVDYGQNREQGHSSSLENGGNGDERKKREGKIDGSSSRDFDNDIHLPSLGKHTRTMDVDTLNHRQGTGRMISSSNSSSSFSCRGSMKRLQMGISEVDCGQNIDEGHALDLDTSVEANGIDTSLKPPMAFEMSKKPVREQWIESTINKSVNSVRPDHNSFFDKSEGRQNTLEEGFCLEGIGKPQVHYSSLFVSLDWFFHKDVLWVRDADGVFVLNTDTDDPLYSRIKSEKRIRNKKIKIKNSLQFHSLASHLKSSLQTKEGQSLQSLNNISKNDSRDGKRSAVEGFDYRQLILQLTEEYVGDNSPKRFGL